LRGAVETFQSCSFGWGAVTHSHPDDVPDAMAYTEWQLGGVSIGGLMLKPPFLSGEEPSRWVVYFAVDDTDRAVAKATSLGARATVAPTDIEPGRFAVIEDPGGASFSVIALKPELAES